MEAYLDNAATTFVFPEVKELMGKVMEEDFGNPSSLHKKGVKAEQYIKEAKETIAKFLKVEPKEIVFTSGGTESNNMALIGSAYANQRRGKHIITTRIEHASVYEPLMHLEKEGFQITYLPVDEHGIVKIDALKEALTDETILVSIMYVNNEIGSIQPIEEIGKIIKSYREDILFHVDAIQAYGKLKIYPKRAKIDLLSVSGHKIHGPKGSGFLYIKDKTKIQPILFGGGQQKGMRSGTENVPAIAGFAKAVEIHSNKAILANEERYFNFKHTLVDGLKKNGIDIEVNGNIEDQMAPQVISIWFKGIRNDVLLTNLDLAGVVGAAGSACTAGSLDPSHVLIAMYGKDSPRVWESLRFSFSIENTIEEVRSVVDTLTKIIKRLNK